MHNKLFKKFRLYGKGPFVWLDDKPNHHCHLGIEWLENMELDLVNLSNSGKALQLNLPVKFIKFMSSPGLWKKFRSIEA